MKRIIPSLSIALILVLAMAGSALAAQWSSTSMSFLKGSGYDVTSSEDATIMTLEHASGWEYGDNFLFFDVFQPFDVDTSIYGEWHPRVSFGKLADKKLAFGPITDVLLAGEINVGNHKRVYLYGVGFNLNIPKFDFFALNIFLRDDMDFDGESTFQISPSWRVPFHIGSARFECGGFLDYSGAEGEGRKAQLMFVPQVLLDVGNFKGAPKRIYAGIEYQYWQNKYGLDGREDNLVQAMVKWFF